jgi:hypothetical protein
MTRRRRTGGRPGHSPGHPGIAATAVAQEPPLPHRGAALGPTPSLPSQVPRSSSSAAAGSASPAVPRPRAGSMNFSAILVCEEDSFLMIVTTCCCCRS